VTGKVIAPPHHRSNADGTKKNRGTDAVKAVKTRTSVPGHTNRRRQEVTL
jgi:hypothetical protein